jgi:hypothetical protein
MATLQKQLSWTMKRPYKRSFLIQMALAITREVVTSTDILTFFRTQSVERLARLVITISADDVIEIFSYFMAETKD